MMMLCGICGEIFDPPDTICPFCGCPLVPSQVPDPSSIPVARRSPEPGKLVELCRPASYPLAMMVKQVLEQNGIPALIPGGNALSIMPHLAFGGQLKIMVPESDFARAREVYRAYFEGEERLEEDPAKIE